MNEPTYTDLRLANLKKQLKQCDEVALVLVENAPNSHDFRLLADNISKLVLQVIAFQTKHKGEQP